MKHATTRVAAAAATAFGMVVVAATPALAAPAVPNPHPQLPGGVQAKVDTGLGMVMALVIAGCVLGILITAAVMAVVHHRGDGGSEVMGRLGRVMGACVLVGTASGLVEFLV